MSHVRMAFDAGVNAAFARFGIKEADAATAAEGALLGGLGQRLRSWGGAAGHALFGQPGRVFTEGPKAFAPGGLLSHENVWWPSTKGLTGFQKVMPWMQRAGTMMVPLQLMQAARSNPHDGTLANVLGTAGNIAGNMYGFPALGAVGAPMLGNLAGRVGRGIGHALGSRPSPQDQYP